MKKSHILLALAVSVLLCACGGEGSPKSPILLEPETSSSLPTHHPGDTGSGSENIPIIVEDDSVPPHEGMVRSKLTNEWVDADVAATRPIAVMTPNETSALPHYNLSEASILYEANVEGRMTRMLAVYEDWQDLEKIGNVRSLRTYYAYWAFEWDAFIVHVGGPFSSMI